MYAIAAPVLSMQAAYDLEQAQRTNLFWTKARCQGVAREMPVIPAEVTHMTQTAYIAIINLFWWK